MRGAQCVTSAWRSHYRPVDSFLRMSSPSLTLLSAPPAEPPCHRGANCWRASRWPYIHITRCCLDNSALHEPGEGGEEQCCLFIYSVVQTTPPPTHHPLFVPKHHRRVVGTAPSAFGQFIRAKGKRGRGDYALERISFQARRSGGCLRGEETRGRRMERLCCCLLCSAGYAGG